MPELGPGRSGYRWHRSLVGPRSNAAETSLLGALAKSGLEVHAVGDCLAPRRANNAIFEGRRLGLKL